MALKEQVARWLGIKSNTASTSAVVRAGSELGPFDQTLQSFKAREVNPWYYEAMREALAPIDSGIGTLVTLDGIVRVEGAGDKVVRMIADEFMPNIPVNDLETGFQAFYSSQGNELYEQGLGIGEMCMDESGRELVGLRVADSKGIYFRRGADLRLETWYRPPASNCYARRDGTDNVETLLRNRVQTATSEILLGSAYAQLDPRQLVYSLNAPEADKPYGVSTLRSLEFVTKIILQIQNATSQTWGRFGDPVFSITYKTKNRSGQQVDLDQRRNRIAADFAAALTAKRKGNSVDFVQAIGADDELTISVIGHDGQVLEMEMPARHMLEMVVSKFKLAAWMLGFQWSTSERLAEQQSELALHESRVRWERRLPGLTRVVETWLRGRRATWKAGDWRLVQEVPNLRDLLKRAQAEFLAAQTRLMLQNGGDLSMLPDAPGTDQGAAKLSRALRYGIGTKWPELEPGGLRPLVVNDRDIAAIREAVAHAADPIDLAERLALALEVDE